MTNLKHLDEQTKACRTCGWKFSKRQLAKNNQPLLYKCGLCGQDLCVNCRNRSQYNRHQVCPTTDPKDVA